uniref:Uncharacterized protein n=1 Tax=Glossina pallidipes TaxID=7398 RepID=A0A1B0AGV1_GLOPL
MITVGSGSIMLRSSGAGHNLEQPAEKSIELKNVLERSQETRNIYISMIVYFRFSGRMNLEGDLRRERSITMPDAQIVNCLHGIPMIAKQTTLRKIAKATNSQLSLFLMPFRLVGCNDDLQNVITRANHRELRSAKL